MISYYILYLYFVFMFFFFFQAEDGIRDWSVTGVQTCALQICESAADDVPGPQFLQNGRKRRCRIADVSHQRHIHGFSGFAGETKGRDVVIAGDVAGQEIGRASCRERVEMWEGGGGVEERGWKE